MVIIISSNNIETIKEIMEKSCAGTNFIEEMYKQDKSFKRFVDVISEEPKKKGD